MGKQIVNMEEKLAHKDQNIALKILNEYLTQSGRKELPFSLTDDYVEDLFSNYMSVKGTQDEDIFLALFNKYKLNFSFIIMNYLDHLLSNDDNYHDDELSLPGVDSYHVEGNKYILHTILGDIEVYKASKIFENTKSRFIFKRKLVHQCFRRTYDFVKKNKDYEAVVAMIPGSFKSVFYHAYATKDNIIVDPAINALFINTPTIQKIYCGREILRLNYAGIEEAFTKVKEEYPDLHNGYILYDLAVPTYKNHYPKK